MSSPIFYAALLAPQTGVDDVVIVVFVVCVHYLSLSLAFLTRVSRSGGTLSTLMIRSAGSDETTDCETLESPRKSQFSVTGLLRRDDMFRS